VRLLFRDAYRFECIENGVAFFFQLSCKIVDANFAHSILLVPALAGLMSVPAALSYS
jgi:hypothetical protein